MRDCVGVLRREIEAVRAAGADTVQLDEPWLATLVDPRFRDRGRTSRTSATRWISARIF